MKNRLIPIIVILIILFILAGCSDSTLNSMLTPDDVDRYITHADDGQVCLESGIETACLTLTPKNTDKNINAPIIHVHPQKLVYIFYYEGKPILRAEQAVDTALIRTQILDDSPPSNGGADTSAPTPVIRHALPPPVYIAPPVNTDPPKQEPPPVIESIPPLVPTDNTPPVVEDTPPPVHIQPPAIVPPPTTPRVPDPPKQDPPLVPTDNNPPVVTQQPPPSNPVSPPQTPPPTNNVGEIDAHHVYNDGWIIWIDYDAPPEAYTLGGSGLTITINGDPETSEKITSFARVVGYDDQLGVQFFYPTGKGDASSLMIEVTGLVSASKTVTFDINLPDPTNPEGVTYQSSSL